MNFVHLVPHIDEEAAGPSYSVPRLCESLTCRGDRVDLMCLAARKQIPGVQTHIYQQWPLFGRFAISSSLARDLWDVASRSDVIHNHSLWSMVNVAAGLIVPRRRAKLVTSPRGTLSAWALSRSPHMKRLLWPLQKRALACADLLHATSEVEYQEIRSLGFKAPVAIIPNGIDIPDRSTAAVASPSDKRTLLFLSRIHPTKGLDRLLEVWARLESDFPEWQLVIVGRGDSSHVQDVMQLSERLRLKRVSFPGPLYGIEKSKAYTEADLFVLPTHSENFGMVVAEALAHGCPAIVSRGAPWSGLEVEGCGWWIENALDDLERTLRVALRLPKIELQTMGLRGRNWMKRDFGWESMGDRMIQAYRWIFTQGTPPAWVRVD